MNKTLRKILIFIGAVTVLVTGTACSVSTQPDQVALAYNDGPFSPRTFDKCVPVSKREVQGPNDVAFAYPANQRTLSFTGEQGSDRGSFSVVSKDGVELQFPGNLQFLLNTDCDTLRAFHEKIGNRYKSYFEGDESEGWVSKVLPLYVAQPLQTALAGAASQYNWRELYNDPSVRVKVQESVTQNLPRVVNDQTEGEQEFFQGFVLTLQVPKPPDALRDAITNEQTVVAQANAKAAQAGAQIAQAVAETRVAEEEAKKKAAQIAGFPDPDSYLKEKAIDKNLNPYQPVIVAPGAAK